MSSAADSTTATSSSVSSTSSVATAVFLDGIPVPVPSSNSGWVWSPVNEGLQQVLSCISDPVAPSSSLKDDASNNAFHQHQYKQLQLLSTHPEFNNYLVYVFSSMRELAESVRSRAGFQVKNHVKENWHKIHPGVQDYIKTRAILTLGDPLQFIRNVAGTIITTIAVKEQLKWPGLLEYLLLMIDSNKFEYMEGAFNALSKICEDCPLHLDSETLGRPLNWLLPKMLSFFLHPVEPIRKYALAAVNCFLANRPTALVVNMDNYMEGLFRLTQDNNKEIRRRVCQAFVILLDVSFDRIRNQLSHIIEFMLRATADTDQDIALEACEFWTVYCESELCDKELLLPHLPTLIQVLLHGMVYSDYDLCMMGDVASYEHDGDNSLVPDRQQDLPPRFHRAKLIKQEPMQQLPNPFQSTEQPVIPPAHHDDDDDEEDDDDEDDEDEVGEWNLRKCSAASLDTLANVYRDKILPILLPLLQQALLCKGVDAADDDKKWRIRESGVLALGAVAEGCYAAMSRYLGELIPFLVNLLSDNRPLVRSITCWTLSRYSRWVLDNEDRKFFEPMLAQLLKRILDKNKKVQEAACSAFATLEEEAQDALQPYLYQILQTLMYAFDRYQAKNMIILYDAIGTLAEAVGRELNKPDFVNLLMPPMMQRWSELADTDRNIFPLLECLTSVASALGMGFAHYAQPVYNRAVQIIQNTIVMQTRAQRALEQNQEGVEFPDSEFIVCALDLLSGLCEGLYENMESLVGANTTLLGLLFECIRHNDPDVRQSAFALLGDLAKYCAGHLLPHVQHFIPQAAANLNPRFISVCNNAAWCLGEIALKAGPDRIKEFVPELVRLLGTILNTTEQVPLSLLENTAITVGRLAMVCPDLIAPSLADLSRNWCWYTARIRDRQETEHAFRGLCNVVALNPSGMLTAGAFPAFVYAIQQWQHPTPDLHTQFHHIINAYKNTLGAQWPNLLAQITQPGLLEYLQKEFQV